MRFQTAPRGLLGFFGLKTEGQNPNEFSDTIVPVVDVTDFYGARRIEEATNSSTGEVAAASIQINVDARHQWWVRAVSARFDFTVLANSADEQWRFTLQYVNKVGGAQFYLDTETVLTSTLALPLGAAATYSVFLKAAFEKPILLPSGGFVQASCSATMSAGSYAIGLRVDTYPIEI